MPTCWREGAVAPARGPRPDAAAAARGDGGGDDSPFRPVVAVCGLMVARAMLGHGRRPGRMMLGDVGLWSGQPLPLTLTLSPRVSIVDRFADAGRGNLAALALTVSGVFAGTLSPPIPGQLWSRLPRVMGRCRTWASNQTAIRGSQAGQSAGRPHGSWSASRDPERGGGASEAQLSAKIQGVADHPFLLADTRGKRASGRNGACARGGPATRVAEDMRHLCTYPS